MKKVLYLLAALALLAACKQPADPIRDAMEQYAKENIEHPETYKFDYMGIEKEYTYFNALAEYMKGLENLKAQAEDKDPYEEALEQAHSLVIEFGSQVACREYSLHFKCKGGQDGTQPLERVVVARYDADGKLMVMTMNPDELPAQPALHQLREMGRLVGNCPGD